MNEYKITISFLQSQNLELIYTGHLSYCIDYVKEKIDYYKILYYPDIIDLVSIELNYKATE